MHVWLTIRLLFKLYRSQTYFALLIIWQRLIKLSIDLCILYYILFQLLFRSTIAFTYYRKSNYRILPNLLIFSFFYLFLPISLFMNRYNFSYILFLYIFFLFLICIRMLSPPLSLSLSLTLLSSTHPHTHAHTHELTHSLILVLFPSFFFLFFI